MDRLADPRIYKCALEQRVETYDWVADKTKYTHCLDVKQVLTPEVYEPITGADQCFVTKRSIAEGKVQPNAK